ncbi:hypothetical protein LXM25_16555 [Dyadobacter sp. LJ53]|uniref:hypothetical protein n=1 Tax=Dyadobacter chenwenxiniae TaxID=2906456 RepID=UPI001F301FA9|nr:hypothetical protein [Dyadobacter chenwenxiniae]MCF0051682.1 hypothetical protein [Dyadobacter chenwenxiniae]
MENIRNIEEVIRTYTSAWNETERGAIREKISRCWAPEGTYTDSITDTIIGYDAITDFIISSYEHMGPRSFHLLAAPEVHHQCGRFNWLAVRQQGYPIQGMDYFEFDSENRIIHIKGFILPNQL